MPPPPPNQRELRDSRMLHPAYPNTRGRLRVLGAAVEELAGTAGDAVVELQVVILVPVKLDGGGGKKRKRDIRTQTLFYSEHARECEGVLYKPFRHGASSAAISAAEFQRLLHDAKAHGHDMGRLLESVMFRHVDSGHVLPPVHRRAQWLYGSGSPNTAAGGTRSHAQWKADQDDDPTGLQSDWAVASISHAPLLKVISARFRGGVLPHANLRHMPMTRAGMPQLVDKTSPIDFGSLLLQLCTEPAARATPDDCVFAIMRRYEEILASREGEGSRTLGRCVPLPPARADTPYLWELLHPGETYVAGAVDMAVTPTELQVVCEHLGIPLRCLTREHEVIVRYDPPATVAERGTAVVPLVHRFLPVLWCIASNGHCYVVDEVTRVSREAATGRTALTSVGAALTAAEALAPAAEALAPAAEAGLKLLTSPKETRPSRRSDVAVAKPRYITHIADVASVIEALADEPAAVKRVVVHVGFPLKELVSHLQRHGVTPAVRTCKREVEAVVLFGRPSAQEVEEHAGVDAVAEEAAQLNALAVAAQDAVERLEAQLASMPPSRKSRKVDAVELLDADALPLPPIRPALQDKAARAASKAAADASKAAAADTREAAAQARRDVQRELDVARANRAIATTRRVQAHREAAAAGVAERAMQKKKARKARAASERPPISVVFQHLRIDDGGGIDAPVGIDNGIDTQGLADMLLEFKQQLHELMRSDEHLSHYAPSVMRWLIDDWGTIPGPLVGCTQAMTWHWEDADDDEQLILGSSALGRKLDPNQAVSDVTASYTSLLAKMTHVRVFARSDVWRPLLADQHDMSPHELRCRGATDPLDAVYKHAYFLVHAHRGTPDPCSPLFTLCDRPYITWTQEMLQLAHAELGGADGFAEHFTVLGVLQPSYAYPIRKAFRALLKTIYTSPLERTVKNLLFSALVGLAGQRRSRVEETRLYATEGEADICGAAMALAQSNGATPADVYTVGEDDAMLYAATRSATCELQSGYFLGLTLPTYAGQRVSLYHRVKYLVAHSQMITGYLTDSVYHRPERGAAALPPVARVEGLEGIGEWTCKLLPANKAHPTKKYHWPHFFSDDHRFTWPKPQPYPRPVRVSLPEEADWAADGERYKEACMRTLRATRLLVDGGAGTGKTAVAVEYCVARAAEGIRTLVVVPTNALRIAQLAALRFTLADGSPVFHAVTYDHALSMRFGQDALGAGRGAVDDAAPRAVKKAFDVSPYGIVVWDEIANAAEPKLARIAAFMDAHAAYSPRPAAGTAAAATAEAARERNEAAWVEWHATGGASMVPHAVAGDVDQPRQFLATGDLLQLRPIEAHSDRFATRRGAAQRMATMDNLHGLFPMVLTLAHCKRGATPADNARIERTRATLFPHGVFTPDGTAAEMEARRAAALEDVQLLTRAEMAACTGRGVACTNATVTFINNTFHAARVARMLAAGAGVTPSKLPDSRRVYFVGLELSTRRQVTAAGVTFYRGAGVVIDRLVGSGAWVRPLVAAPLPCADDAVDDVEIDDTEKLREEEAAYRAKAGACDDDDDDEEAPPSGTAVMSWYMLEVAFGLAYASTAHKAQGQSWGPADGAHLDNTLVLSDTESRMSTCESLYVALTRMRDQSQTFLYELSEEERAASGDAAARAELAKMVAYTLRRDMEGKLWSAEQAAVDSELPPEERRYIDVDYCMQLLEEAAWQCAHCSVTLEAPRQGSGYCRNPHQFSIDAKARGAHTKANVAMICIRCNKQKGRTLEQ